MKGRVRRSHKRSNCSPERREGEWKRANIWEVMPEDFQELLKDINTNILDLQQTLSIIHEKKFIPNTSQ